MKLHALDIRLIVKADILTEGEQDEWLDSIRAAIDQEEGFVDIELLRVMSGHLALEEASPT